MPNPRSVRSSQRSVLACTNCSRRKIKCSKTIPCTACVRQSNAAQCQREPVAVVSRRSVGRSKASTALDDPPPVPVPEAASVATVSSASIEEVPTTVNPAAGSTATSINDSLPQIDERMIEHLLTSLSTPDTRLTNEAAAMLEFLTHGRRNILNQFIGRESIYTSMTQPVQKWNTFLPVEDARSLLAIHEKHLTWMHNTVHMPTFLREFDENILKIACDSNWIALYYALLSQTLYHLDNDYLSSLPQPITVDSKASRTLFDKSREMLHKAEFMDKHKLTSVQTICLLVQVAHNFDKSDLTCVLVSAAIRIAQCLNLHRLGHDDHNVVCHSDTHSVIDREISFQNTCQIHYSQFNTQMPANCHDDEERMIKDGRVDVHPAEISTITTWTNCLAQMSVVMWRHHDHMLRKGSTETDDIDGRYDEVIRADEEIKSLYLSWSGTLRDVNTTPSDNPASDGLPTGLMPAMLLMSIAQKIFTVHRQFQLSCFRDRRYAFSQLSCVTIAKRSIEAFQRWPDCLEARICRRMWTTLSYMISCSITLLFALLFKAQNALTHDWDRLRGYVEFGKDILGKEAQASSIARRGVQLLSALMELERTSGFSSDIEADIGDTIRRVALADDDVVEANPGEGYQMVFPYGQDLWESLMRDPTEGELI
ncbi:Putative transcriptional regulatory protein C11D3.07c [Fusarium odoratissimum]|uniref:Putative transcriptional regulatory protein C11D3.07c n=1 Tax=Fusarium oxysporum f. sp. cubense (strain race 4) TaxID=2502994 RepID=N1S2T0_FUSC4|nr:Putative transcriptional regulatory protein C11D3.07c [Fusarium odoratissimum]